MIGLLISLFTYWVYVEKMEGSVPLHLWALRNATYADKEKHFIGKSKTIKRAGLACSHHAVELRNIVFSGN